LAGWDYRAVWGETFRGAPALANVEFLRGYAGCDVPEGLALAIALALDGASSAGRDRAPEPAPPGTSYRLKDCPGTTCRAAARR